MEKHNVNWICREIRSCDRIFATRGDQVELEGYIRGSFRPGTTVVNMEDIHKDLNDLLSGQTIRINKVIFNPPATIVLWEDGDKTVVKIQNNETYDPEKGLAMAIVKKALGNEGNYFNHIKKWVDQYREEQAVMPKEKKTPIKGYGENGRCEHCKWSLSHSDCQSHPACNGCSQFDERNKKCKCLNVSPGDPCPYFEEVSNDD